MREERKQGVGFSLPLIVFVATVVLVVLGWLWTKREGPPRPAEPEASSAPAPPPSTATPPPPSPLEQEWLDATGAAPEWPADFGHPSSCAAALESVRSIAATIDARDPGDGAGGGEPTFDLILDSAAALERKTPSVSGRIDDGKALHANVVHLFLALGPERLARLVQLSRRQGSLAEPLALALYQWLQAGDASCPQGAKPPRPETQYAYAGFLLQTIGGQAYLRRRSPRLEALTSVYALLVADAAIARGTNPAGLDLRPEIERCKALMAEQPLVFRERYLELLSDLEARWRNPPTAPRAGRP